MKTWIVVVMMAAAIMAGCQEEQKVWGRGELPAEWVEYFGNDNDSRVNFVLVKRFNQIGQLVAQINERLRRREAIDPNDYRGPPGPQGPVGEPCVQYYRDTTKFDESWKDGLALPHNDIEGKLTELYDR